MLSSLLYADDGLVLDNNQPIKTRAHIQKLHVSLGSSWLHKNPTGNPLGPERFPVVQTRLSEHAFLFGFFCSCGRCCLWLVFVYLFDGPHFLVFFGIFCLVSSDFVAYHKKPSP